MIEIKKITVYTVSSHKLYQWEKCTFDLYCYSVFTTSIGYHIVILTKIWHIHNRRQWWY